MATISTHHVDITFKALPESPIRLTINSESAIKVIDIDSILQANTDGLPTYHYVGDFNTRTVFIKLEALPDTIIDLTILINGNKVPYAISKGNSTVSYISRVASTTISFSKDEPNLNNYTTKPGQEDSNGVSFIESQITRGQDNADNEQNFTVEVFYATNRLKKEDNKKVHFSAEKSPYEIINYGICQINVPARKMLGRIPRPIWWKLQFKPNLKKHMSIIDIESMDSKVYFRKLGDRVNASAEKEAFIFIHGFNVNFEEACLRAAQICVDISFEGAPIMYSWPSQGSALFYTADGDSIEYSIPLIMQFLKDVRDRTGAQNIHIIAHSMGNRGLTRALIQLKNENFYNQFIFNQVILAAPDINAATFINQIAPQLKNCSKRVTLYASSKDKALLVSKGLNKAARAGDSYPEIVCVDGIDTIDASDVNTDLLGHGYFASTQSLITDIYHLIKNGHPPNQRNLLPLKKESLFYWKLKRTNK